MAPIAPAPPVGRLPPLTLHKVGDASPRGVPATAAPPTRVAAGASTDWPQQPFWFRSRGAVEDDPLLRACALTFVSDLGMVSTARPPGHEEPGPGGAASLDHALWLHRPGDPNDWHCYDAIGISHRAVTPRSSR